MSRTLVNLILSLIQKEGQSAEAIRNLLGSPVINVANPVTTTASSHWKIYSLPNVVHDLPLAPDDIMNQISTIQMHAAPVLNGTYGELIFNVNPGTVLATTIINVPHAVSVQLKINAPSNQISVYLHDTLLQRGSNQLTTILNVPAGKTAVNVVTQGSKNSTVTLNLPPDIDTDFTAFLPPAPTWLNSGTINPAYIDPSSGDVGVQLFWNNQSSVGGWNVYQAYTNDFGTIQSCSTVNGKYIITTNFSGTALLPYPGSIGQINQLYIGVLEESIYVVDDNISVFRFKSFDLGDSVFSGTLSTINFTNIAIVPRNSNDSIVSFTDLSTQIGTTYSYTIDSFSMLDSTIRSDKIEIKTVTLPNIPGVALATLSEQTAGYLTLALSGVDPQVRYWSGWVRKNNWPTIISGSADAQLDNDYLRWNSVDFNQTTYTFSAGTGFWYGIVVPYDANNNSGVRVLCSGQVTGVVGGSGGTSSTVPTITQLGVDVFIQSGTGRVMNKVWWKTNQAGERPDSANGAIQVQILAFNAIETPSGAVDITAPTPRFLWQDWEDTSSNFGNTTNVKILYGSIVDTLATVRPAIYKYSVWQYTVNIISGATTLGSYNVSIGGNYSYNTFTGGGGGGGGRLKF